MILETKQILFRAHVHLLERRSRNAYDHLYQTISMHVHLLERRSRNAYDHLYQTISVYAFRNSDISDIGCPM